MFSFMKYKLGQLPFLFNTQEIINMVRCEVRSDAISMGHRLHLLTNQHVYLPPLYVVVCKVFSIYFLNSESLEMHSMYK